MRTRNIEKTLAPGQFNWVGDAFYTTSFVGNQVGIARHRMDPFIAIGYNKPYEFSARTTARGVGGHPHKGFETLTMAYQGKIAHKDSRGNYGVIGEGDAQWMTAGSGILHEEYHEEEWSKKGGVLQMVQIWVNLPAKDRETPAHYQDLRRQDLAKVQLDNNAGLLEIFAGEYQGLKGTATTYSPINLFNVRLNLAGEATFNFPADYNTAFIVIAGSVLVNGETVVNSDNFAMLENNNGDKFILKAIEENTIVLMLSGMPLNEPLIMHGPFVMNTEQEITKAIHDFQSGKFGRI
jgi:redox-sensitive bicupin YhaK (pirin superfamily)